MFFISTNSEKVFLVYRSIYQSIYLSIRLSIYLSIYLSICKRCYLLDLFSKRAIMGCLNLLSSFPSYTFWLLLLQLSIKKYLLKRIIFLRCDIKPLVKCFTLMRILLRFMNFTKIFILLQILNADFEGRKCLVAVLIYIIWTHNDNYYCCLK